MNKLTLALLCAGVALAQAPGRIDPGMVKGGAATKTGNNTYSGTNTYNGPVVFTNASRLAAKAGTTLPATCTTGDVFFKTDAVAGQNWYGCTATNTWTVQAGAPGGGDVTQSGNNTFTGSNVFTNATRFAAKAGTALPATCTVGDVFFDTDATAGRNWFGCTATNVWTLEGDGNSGGSGTGINLPPVTFSGGTITVCADCATTPASAVLGVTGVTYSSPSSLTLIAVTSDTNVGVYLDWSGNVVFRYPLAAINTVSVSNGTTSTTGAGMTTGDIVSHPLAVCAVNTSEQVTSCTDYRGVQARKTTGSGGIVVNETPTGPNVDGSGVSGSGSVTLFSSAGEGWWTPFPMGYSPTTSLVNNANFVTVYELVLPGNATVRTLHVNVNGEVASSYLSFCFYARAGSLVTNGQGTTVDTSTTGIKTVTYGGGGVSITGGTKYLLAMTATHNTIAVGTAGNGPGTISELMSPTGHERSWIAANVSTGTSTLTCPATLGSLTAAQKAWPSIVLKP